MEGTRGYCWDCGGETSCGSKYATLCNECAERHDKADVDLDEMTPEV